MPGAEDYLATVRSRLQAEEFEIVEQEGFVLWAHKRRFRPSRFGFEDASVAIAELGPGARGADLVEVADRALAVGLATKARLPRGFGSFALVYPVALVDRAGSDLAEAARTRRKHWAMDEFRVLIETGRHALTENDQRQLWGAAYFKAIRAQAIRLLAP